MEPEKCRTTGLRNMGRHGETGVKPGAKIAYFRHRLNVNCANTDRTWINFQQLLSRSNNKKFRLIIIN